MRQPPASLAASSRPKKNRCSSANDSRTKAVLERVRVKECWRCLDSTEPPHPETARRRAA